MLNINIYHYITGKWNREPPRRYYEQVAWPVIYDILYHSYKFQAKGKQV